MMNIKNSVSQLHSTSTARLVIVVTLTYLLLGAFGLMLAISPGYASPIFPASGLALAFVLWFNRRVLPGVWLGSMLLNVAQGGLYGRLTPTTVFVALLIATGAVLQAWIGCWLVNRWQGGAWREMKHEREAFMFLLLGGALSCLISASFGVTGLYLAGVINQTDVLFSWWNWYVGDTLGVFVFGSLTVRLLDPRGWQQTDRYRYTIVPVLLILSLLWLAFYGTSRLIRNEQQSIFINDSKAIAKRISDRLITHREVLVSLHNFIEVTPGLSFKQFEQFTRITLQDNPDIFALSFNDLIIDARRPAFEQLMNRLSPLGEFHITERDSRKRLVRAAERPEYVPVRYIVPLATSKPAVGFDINSEPVRRDAINRARVAKSMAVTSPIQLVQEQKKRVGVLELMPVEHALTAGATGQGTRLYGFAVSVIKVDEMIEIATRGHLPAGLLFQLTDPRAEKDKALLYRFAPAGVDTAQSDRNSEWNTLLRIGDRDWRLSVTATESYLQQHRPWIAWGIGAFALVIAGLLQLLIVGITGRTNEIKRTNEAVSAHLDNLFNCANVPIIVWDADFKITRFSSAFEMITWKKAEEVIGTDISGLFPEDQVAVIMELIKSAQQGERWEAVEIPIRNISGSIRTVLWNSSTIYTEDGTTPVATIAQGYDITERKQAQLAMSELNAELSESLAMLEQEMAERQNAQELLQQNEVELQALADTLKILNEQQLLKNIELEQWLENEIRENREKDSMLLHQDKLASIGQLAAGVAHEINNPMGFIMGNLNTLKEYVISLQKYCRIVEETVPDSSRSALQEARKQLDLDYILDDLAPLLAESTEGAERVRRIVLDLKDFARPDEQAMYEVDLNQLVQSTINIVRNELKYVAQLDLRLGELPSLLCHPQQINQVISNLLVNAAHAIEQQGVITVTTSQQGGNVVLNVADTGKGIPPELLSRIFDPFFTTKAVGKGTGLGLSISYDIIKKHNGVITVESLVGKGTTFTVKLPLNQVQDF